jgi:hypothetical protein
MIHNIPAVRKQMPRNGGTTLRMRRYNPLNTAMVPLGNSGVTPRMSGRLKSSLIDLETVVH